jgi:hypothetical protein
MTVLSADFHAALAATRAAVAADATKGDHTLVAALVAALAAHTSG